jgi:hypothetical protein
LSKYCFCHKSRLLSVKCIFRPKILLYFIKLCPVWNVFCDSIFILLKFLCFRQYNYSPFDNFFNVSIVSTFGLYYNVWFFLRPTTPSAKWNLHLTDLSFSVIVDCFVSLKIIIVWRNEAWVRLKFTSILSSVINLNGKKICSVWMWFLSCHTFSVWGFLNGWDLWSRTTINEA